MTVNVDKPAQSLANEIGKHLPDEYSAQLFWFDGDSSETTFALGSGWRPRLVFDDGALMREGTAEDYTVEFDGYIYSVVFAVAPAAVSVGIDCVRES